MKKPLFSRQSIGSFHVMMGVFFIFIQEVYGCPILYLTGHTSDGLWCSRPSFSHFKKNVSDGSIKRLSLVNQSPSSGFARSYESREDGKLQKKHAFVDSSLLSSRDLSPAISTSIINNGKWLLEAKSPSQFLIYDPCSLNYSGLERLLNYSPGIDFDFIRTFFTGIPHGKWTPADIWARLISASGPVPEPSTMLILGSGLIGIALFGRKPND